MNEFSLFDLLPNAEEFKPKKATDWKWTMANDYPPKNGLKVFSCFACGGGVNYGLQISRVRCNRVLRNRQAHERCLYRKPPPKT